VRRRRPKEVCGCSFVGPLLIDPASDWFDQSPGHRPRRRRTKRRFSFGPPTSRTPVHSSTLHAHTRPTTPTRYLPHLLDSDIPPWPSHRICTYSGQHGDRRLRALASLCAPPCLFPCCFCGLADLFSLIPWWKPPLLCSVLVPWDWQQHSLLSALGCAYALSSPNPLSLSARCSLSLPACTLLLPLTEEHGRAAAIRHISWLCCEIR
jgi:hypothetical protein